MSEETVKNNILLMCEFTGNNYGLFQEFLEERDIEPTEAEVMLDNIRQNMEAS